MLMTFQNLTASVMSVVSNVVFSQTLSKKIPQYAPSVDARAALHAGSDAHAVRNLVLGHEDELVGVLQAYSEGLRNIFYLLVGVSGVAIVASSGMGWVDVRKTVAKAKNSNEQAEQVSVV